MLKFMLDTNTCIFTIKNKPGTHQRTLQPQYIPNVYQLHHLNGADLRC